jgi:hypothetical protein
LEILGEDSDRIMAINVKSELYGLQAIMQYRKRHLINGSLFPSYAPFASNRTIYSVTEAVHNILTANLYVDLRKEYPNIYIYMIKERPGKPICVLVKKAVMKYGALGLS